MQALPVLQPICCGPETPPLPAHARHELAHADLAGVLAQHVDELQSDRIAERLGHLGHPDRMLAIDVRVDDRLTTRLARGSLLLRGQFEIDRHRFTMTD